MKELAAAGLTRMSVPRVLLKADIMKIPLEANDNNNKGQQEACGVRTEEAQTPKEIPRLLRGIVFLNAVVPVHVAENGYDA